MNEASARRATGNIVLIGGAPVRVNFSPLVDMADLVIRFNDLRQFGGGVGTRTDVLCITNTGEPARKLVSNAPLRRVDSIRRASIWMSRDTDCHRRRLQALRAGHPDFAKGYPDSELEDFSDAIVRANALEDQPLERFSSESNDRAFNKLARLSVPPFVMPSTGFLALERVLAAPEYAHYRVHLVGFSFTGWIGHPWAAECAMVAAYAAANRVVYYPV